MQRNIVSDFGGNSHGSSKIAPNFVLLDIYAYIIKPGRFQSAQKHSAIWNLYTYLFLIKQKKWKSAQRYPNKSEPNI